jgi:hypothetical protein
MTIESAASRPGHAPTATKLSSKEVLWAADTVTQRRMRGMHLPALFGLGASDEVR